MRMHGGWKNEKVYIKIVSDTTFTFERNCLLFIESERDGKKQQQHH